MAASILQDEKKCYVCGTLNNLHEHHVFFGANRKVSEENGFKVWLCGDHHNQSNRGVHCGNKELNLMLKKHCQMTFEESHSREEFVALIGRNYLD